MTTELAPCPACGVRPEGPMWCNQWDASGGNAGFKVKGYAGCESCRVFATAPTLKKAAERWNSAAPGSALIDAGKEEKKA